jgi:hypothetical protein
MTNPFALPDTQPAPAPTTAPASNPFTAPATTPPAAPAAPAYGGGDPFDAPAPQEARGPRIKDLYGRLLLIIPHKVEYGVPNRLQPGTTQDRMTADVITLDGGPINYGGAPEKTPPVPHNKVAQVPHLTKRQFISNTGLISQCRDALAKRQRGEPGMVLGRLTVGQVPANGGNPPYLLTPATEEDKAIARAYLATVDPFA